MSITPTELRLDAGRQTLTLTWADHPQVSLSAELLRVLSPSAEVQGHSAEQRVTIGGKIDVKIMDIVAVGNYAVRIIFDDGHQTGIYSWQYLRELANNKHTYWQAYLQELAAKSMSRHQN